MRFIVTGRGGTWFGLVIACLFALLGEIMPARADSAQYYYDPAGRLTTMVDPVNGSARYIYDASGNVLSIVRRPITAILVAQLSPSSGVAGTTVTISGTGFGTTANTTVSFNGHVAAPSAVTATQITVAVPSGAASGPVTVTSPAGTAASLANFTVLTGTAPTITSLSPTQADQGSTVTVSGSNFDPLLVNDKVFVNGRYALATAAATSSLTMVVPAATSGHVQVETPHGSAISSGYLVVPPLPYLVSNIGSVVQSALGSTATSAVGTARKYGLILFDATAGQQLAMQVTASTFSAATLALYGPDGTAIGQETAVSSGSFIDKQVLPYSGTYTVLVAPSSTTGSMTVNLINVPPDVTATLTANATPVSLTTTAPGQNMSPTFTGIAGQKVALNVLYTGGLASSCSAWAIIGPVGSTQLASGSTCGGSVFTGVLTLPGSGTYTVQVNPGSAATGTAAFTLYNVPADATATIPANGTPVSLTTTAPGQNMSLTFSGTAGQRIALKDQYDSNINATCATWAIINPGGTTQLYSSTLTCGTPNFTDVLILPTTGTYTILLSPGWPAFGTATFTLYNVPPDVTGTIAANATPVSLTTTVPGQNMSLTFSGTAGQRIALKDQLDSNLNAQCPTWEIINPDGTTQLYPSTLTCGSPNFTDVLVLPTTGTYTIQFNPGFTATGTATFTLYTVPPDITGTIAANATPVSLTTTVPGQNMSLTFSGTAGQRIALKDQLDSYLNAQCPAWAIINPGGTTQLYSSTLTCGSPNFADVLILPTTGTYTIQFNPGFTATGTATFTLYTVPPDASATITPGGGSVSLTATTPGQNLSLTFAGTAGHRISLLGQYDSNLSSNCYGWQIVEPDGATQLYSATTACGSSSFTGVLTLPTTGTYAIKFNPGSTATGTATFTLYNVPTDASGTTSIGQAAANYTTTAPGQAIRVSFAGTANQSVTVKVTVVSTPSSSCYNITTLEPNGTTVLRGDLSCSSSYSSGSLILPQTGTYTVVVAPNGTMIGTFSVGVSTP
jgi:YD repeat-containing protein